MIISRIVLVISAVALLLFYVFQKNIFELMVGYGWTGYQEFLFVKSVRFIVNDILMIGVIYGLFKETKYIKLAVLVQIAGLIFLLLPYLLIKYHYMGYNGPLISFLHRLILNPLLMILLIPAIYYQKYKHNIS